MWDAHGLLPITSQEAFATDDLVKKSGRQDAQKRVFIGYAGEDYHFVDQLKNKLEPFVGSVWVDWENVVPFEDNLASEPAYKNRIQREVQDAALIIFIVSKNWIGKKFPMLELEWALNVPNRGTRVLPVLLDWSLPEAKERIPSENEVYARLLKEFFKLTILNHDNSYRPWDKLTTLVAEMVLERPGIAPSAVPANWVERKADVAVITDKLGMSEQGEPRELDEDGCVVAVEGMSGVGKSALLKYLYNVARPKYVAAGRKVVLVTVGHDASDTKIKDVQKKILKGLGFPVNEGEDMELKLNVALGREGYALFLDDVWHQAPDTGHLADLFGDEWNTLLSRGLAKGSFVVLAGQALPKRSWWYKHHLDVLDVDSAKKLFRNHAFNKDDEGYGLPWEEVVDACAGLPLALTVFGCELDGVEDIQEWKRVLTALKSATSPLGRLKVAYTLLREEEHKEAFVDIAMHWHDKDWEVVDAALGDGLLAELLRRNLVDKGRRDLYNGGEESSEVVCIHDLLKKVGEGEAKTSWLLDPSPEKVKNCRPRGVKLTPRSGTVEFKDGLSELRVLLAKDHFPGKIEMRACRELRWLQWPGCPDTSEDLSAAANMVWLDLHKGAVSSIKFPSAPTKLEWLDLWGCTSLTSLPELSALTRLKWLRLKFCTSLTSLPAGLSALTSLKWLELNTCRSLPSLPELSGLTKLKWLDLRDCKSLTSLPELSALTNLQTLDLCGCTSLMSLPELLALINLERLNLQGCTSLTSLPKVFALTKLQRLDLQGCTRLTSLPELSTLINLKRLDLSDCTSLTSLPELSALTKLEMLYLLSCWSLTSLPELSALTKLNQLNLKGCTRLTSLPELAALTNLEMLYLQGCTRLTSLPELSALTNLEMLALWGCASLTSLPELSALTKLSSLDLWGCAYLTSLPELSELTNLKRLRLNLQGCTSLPALSALTNLEALDLSGCTSLPELSALTNLEALDLSGCTSLTSLPELSALTNLEALDLSGCTSLTSLPEVTALTNLEMLRLQGCTSLTSLTELWALTNLERLNLQGCASLTSLAEQWALTNLERLNLQGCTSLTSLPDLSALTKLKQLNVQGCTSLTSLPELSTLTNLEIINLQGCTRLTSLPELSALNKLSSLDLRDCTSLSGLSGLSALTNLKRLDLSGCTSMTFSTLNYVKELEWLTVILPETPKPSCVCT